LKVKTEGGPPSLGQRKQNYQVPREKNRLTLRSFLRQLLSDKKLIKSRHLVYFLMHDHLPGLNKEDEADIERRIRMDRLRLEEQMKFFEESKKRAKELDKWLREFKTELIQKRTCKVLSLLITIEGLTKLFDEIKVKESIKDLSPEYQQVAEWAKIEYVHCNIELI
jgi:Domain of unknown function in PX-proteins (DUF3818)